MGSFCSTALERASRDHDQVQILHLAGLFLFLCSQYIAPICVTTVNTHFKAIKSILFKELEYAQDELKDKIDKFLPQRSSS